MYLNTGGYAGFISPTVQSRLRMRSFSANENNYFAILAFFILNTLHKYSCALTKIYKQEHWKKSDLEDLEAEILH